MRIGKLAAALLLISTPVAAQVDPGRLEHWKYDNKLPLDLRQAGVQERGSVKVFDVTYLSPTGARSKAVGPNGGTVSAYLVVPAGKGPFPAVIYAHWCMPGSEKKESDGIFGRSRGAGAVRSHLVATGPRDRATEFRGGRFPI